RATGIAEQPARIRITVVEIGVVEITEVEHVEHVDSDPQRGPCEAWEVLAEAEIDCSIRPRMQDEIRLRRRETTGNVARWVESYRTANVLVCAGAECDKAAELDAVRVRHIHGPVGHHASLLVVRWVLGDADRVREVEQVTQIVLTLHRTGGVR